MSLAFSDAGVALVETTLLGLCHYWPLGCVKAEMTNGESTVSPDSHIFLYLKKQKQKKLITTNHFLEISHECIQIRTGH